MLRRLRRAWSFYRWYRHARDYHKPFRESWEYARMRIAADEEEDRR